jgi:hypothetical protein
VGQFFPIRPTIPCSPAAHYDQFPTPCLPQNPSHQPTDRAGTSLSLTLGPRSQPLSPLRTGPLGALTCGVRMSNLPPISHRVRNRHCSWCADSGDSSTEPSPVVVNRGHGPARSWSPGLYKCRAPQTPARAGRQMKRERKKWTPPQNLAWDVVRASGTRPGWSAVRMDGVAGTLKHMEPGVSRNSLSVYYTAPKSTLRRGQGL